MEIKYSTYLIEAVWQKASPTEEHNSSIARRDRCGTLIFKDKYGNRNSKFGWEIDHIIPLSRNGSDDLSNLRPLQWENNVATSGTGILTCPTNTNSTYKY